MGKVTDKRLLERKKKRSENIRKRFEELWRKGYRTEVAYEMIMDEFTLSESTITQIIKKQGKYKD